MLGETNDNLKFSKIETVNFYETSEIEVVLMKLLFTLILAAFGLTSILPIWSELNLIFHA